MHAACPDGIRTGIRTGGIRTGILVYTQVAWRQAIHCNTAAGATTFGIDNEALAGRDADSQV